MLKYIAMIFLLLLSGCGGTSPAEQTLQAQVNTRGTEVSDRYQTVTVEADRLQTTLEAVDTALARVQGQRVNMISTLEARGIVVELLPGITVQPSTATPTPLGLSGNLNPPTATPLGAFNTLPPLSPTVATGFNSPLGLQNILTAPQVGDDDCAVNPTSQFTPQTPEIYVVARAVDFGAGTTVTTRWSRDDNVLATFDFTYDAINDVCIWFFIDQTDFDFVPGRYTISIDVNGTVAAQVPFTIVATDGG